MYCAWSCRLVSKERLPSRIRGLLGSWRLHAAIAPVGLVLLSGSFSMVFLPTPAFSFFYTGDGTQRGLCLPLSSTHRGACVLFSVFTYERPDLLWGPHSFLLVWVLVDLIWKCSNKRCVWVCLFFFSRWEWPQVDFSTLSLTERARSSSIPPVSYKVCPNQAWFLIGTTDDVWVKMSKQSECSLNGILEKVRAADSKKSPRAQHQTSAL